MAITPRAAPDLGRSALLNSNPLRKAKPAPKVTRPRVTPKGKGKPKLTPPKTPKIGDLRSLDQLTKIATEQTDAELSGQIQPLQTQATQTAAREAAAHAQEESMFNELQSHVSGAAQMVSDSYDKTNAAEQAIFAAAGQRLNSLKQNTASEAQQLAQKIGGPVAVSDFTDPVDASIGAAGAEQAGQLLHDMGLAQAGREYAGRFAGQVFPLIRAQKEATTRTGYEDQIKEIQDHITQLQGTRSGAINSKLNDLQTKEREYALQKAQSQLESLKTKHDWEATVHTLKNDDARLALAGGQFGLQKAGVTGTYAGKPTLAAKTEAAKIRALTASQKLEAQKLGMSNKEFALKLAATEEGLQIQRQRVQVQQQKNSMQMIDALLNPKSDKPITITHKVYIPKGSQEESAAQLGAISGKRKDVHQDQHGRWYTYQKKTVSTSDWAAANTGGTPITDSRQIYNFLVNQGISPKLARVLVKRRTGHDPVPSPPKGKNPNQRGN